jgi:hypothetical protein
MAALKQAAPRRQSIAGELAVIVHIQNDYTYHSELRAEAQAVSMPLSTDDVTPTMAELVEEMYTRAILAEQLPYQTDELNVTITPMWSTAPAVDGSCCRMYSTAGPGFAVRSTRSSSCARTARSRRLSRHIGCSSR